MTLNRCKKAEVDEKAFSLKVYFDLPPMYVCTLEAHNIGIGYMQS
jgi:hypothetical protein